MNENDEELIKELVKKQVDIHTKEYQRVIFEFKIYRWILRILTVLIISFLLGGSIWGVSIKGDGAK